MTPAVRILRRAAGALANDWRRTTRDPRRLATRVWLLLGAALALGLWYSPPTTGDALGIRRFRTPEIAGSLRIAQQFVMRERMLTGVEVRPGVVGDVAGALRFTFTDLTTEQVIQAVDVSARDVVKDDRFSLWIGRIDDSQGHWFELAISSSTAAPARGVAFWATRGERLDNAMLLINGAERWADLAFRATTPATSMIEGLGQPEGRTRRLVVMAALIVVWVLVGMLLRTIAASPRLPLPAEHLS
jgi:hypothetical protein